LADVGAGVRRFVLAAILLAALGGCSESARTRAASPTESPGVRPTPRESPAATCDGLAHRKIDLVADNVRFSAKCLVVPAEEPLQVEFVNRDFMNHNFSIYSLEFSGAFTGDVAYPAERFRYEVPALEAGQYLFRCDIHPTDMSGPLIAQ
jgi:plastocyanin